MMNHKNNGNESFVGTMIVLTISVIVVLFVILGVDGIAMYWEMITG